MTRYIRWDYDNNEAIEYVREGECNRCGACCKAMIKFAATVYPDLGPNAVYDGEDIRNGGGYVDVSGIWNEVQNASGARRFFKFLEIDPTHTEPCPMLVTDEAGQYGCSVHFDKNLLCAAWPLAPEHVTPFDKCSYTFREIARWTISEDPNKPIPDPEGGNYVFTDVENEVSVEETATENA